MAYYLIAFALIIFTCFFLNKASARLGIPVLLSFLMLGILYGSRYDSFALDYGPAVDKICSICLIFIMFYGGFGTRWSSAKPVIVESGILATVGVALTAAFVGLFCHFALQWRWVESLLMGAVISSTDAATVFSTLRTHRLGLKNHSAPLIEVESGSNDPMSYMLTAVMLSVLKGQASGGQVVWTITSQLLFGIIGGLVIATAAIYLLKRIKLKSTGFDSLLIFAIALVSYSLPNIINGNGYLSAYIVGIALGNAEFPEKKMLVSFFDGITSLCQILIFFLLGMLTIPANLIHAIVPALLIFAFLTLIARPLAVGGILLPFKKYPMKQIGLISFVGLRGAASIVFAIMILTAGDALQNDIFSIVFCIVLISMALQGSLIPWMAKKFDQIDTNEDVMTTFSDFSDNTNVSFGKILIRDNSNWKGLAVKELNLPQGCLITMILRGKDCFSPNGDTIIEEKDTVILCMKSYEDVSNNNLVRHELKRGSKWAGKPLREYHQPGNMLLVMIRRGEKEIIPDGETILAEGDFLYLLNIK